MNPKIILPILISSVLIIGIFRLPVQAQSSEEAWSLPKNISNSGAAQTPAAAIDAQGVIHVLWMDGVAGLQYSRFKDGQWSAPRNLALTVFRRTVPTLVATSGGYVHAFWINDNDELFYSKVVAQYMGDFRSWYATVRLDMDVNKFTVQVSDTGTINLAYVKVSDAGGSPAGIYYRRTLDEGSHWWKPVRLFDSAYIRSLTADDANVQVSSTSSENNRYVYVVWDNPFQKQVFLSRSSDEGRNFNAPVEIDRPDLSINSTNPFHIQVSAQGEQVVLVWQNGDPGSSCTQFYTVSDDAGITWNGRHPMLEQFSGCAQANAFLPLNTGPIILYTLFQNQAYFLAFNGEQWSEPQFQQGISSFGDPATLNTVVLGCLHVLPAESDVLYVVGCDTGDGKDVWVTSRVLSNTEDWFAPPSIWLAPSQAISSTETIHDLTSVVDTENRIHVLWSADQPAANRRSMRVIDYSRMDNSSWSEAHPVLISTDGKAEQPTVALDSNDRLIVGWSGGVAGDLFFNTVDATLAFAINRWTNPVPVPSPRETSSSPKLYYDANGTIFLAYLIPLNEDRGVYITHSEDQGVTWSDPVKVFDGVEAGWDMIGSLSFSGTQNGALHLLWTRSTPPGGIGNTELWYSHSEDSGSTWSEATQIADAPVIWSQVLGVGEQSVHIAWQEDTPDQPTLNHEISIDGGLSWQKTSGVSSPGDVAGAVTLAANQGSGVSLLRIVRDASLGQLVLQHYTWGGDSWSSEASLSLGLGVNTPVTGLSTDITPDGRMDVLYSTDEYSDQAGVFNHYIYYTSRQLDVTGETIAIVPTLTPTPELTPTASPTPPPPPTPTPQLNNVDLGQNNSPLSGSSGGLIIGVSLAFVIVALAFGVGIRMRKGLP